KKKYDQKLTQQNEKDENNLSLSSDIEGFPTIVYKTPQGSLKISGGNKLPLTDATIAAKYNINKINEFLLLTSISF
ncbi:DsbC family protein, partial [Francisella tularensis subsp. holarctica]|nr:DsbC family protein [Francisella tularensis subsp. holarctica]